ncbi:MAG: glycogen/starch synthase, partial [bacterium]|nr:glycogen/starch synthase [bacterium]
MANRNLKVLFVSAEVAPFSTVGGLAQVSYFLPRALLNAGCDVRIFTPKYALIDEKKFPMKIEYEKLDTDGLISNVKIYETTKKGEPTVYFLENMEYYEKRANVYGYNDDHIRFALLSKAALEFVKTGDFVPDVIHINDWHTGYLANYLRTDYKDDPILKKIAVLYSIHNLHQGSFDFAHASEMDFDDGKSPLVSFFDERLIKQNALKRGVIYADLVNTVSETYAREITTEEFGRGLHNLFKELRGKISGVLNGLDYKEFNPATDKIIAKNYSSGNLKARQENKKDLQKDFGFKQDPEIPLMTFWGRLDGQKGIDLIKDTIRFLLAEFNIQFVIVGPAEQYYKEFFLQLEKDYPGRVGTHLMYDPILPRKLAAGADILLQPSYYEPGGIVVIEAMRYGCIPVVRAVGGLADSVSDEVGFSFKDFNAMSFIVAVTRALELYKNKKEWEKLVKRAMNQNFSWDVVANKYLDLYSRVATFRKEALSPNPPTA